MTTAPALPPAPVCDLIPLQWALEDIAATHPDTLWARALRSDAEAIQRESGRYIPEDH